MSRADPSGKSNPAPAIGRYVGTLPTVPVTSLVLSTGLMAVYFFSLSTYSSSKLLSRS